MTMLRGIQRACLVTSIMTSFVGTTLAVEIRGPSPDHVWDVSEDGNWAGLGRPETDDVILTLSCETEGKANVLLLDYAPMPEGKEGDGGVATAVLRRPGIEVTVVGMLSENTMNGSYDLSFQQGLDHPLFAFLKGDGMAEIEVEQQYQNKATGGHRTWISLKGAKKAVERFQSACSNTPKVAAQQASRSRSSDKFAQYTVSHLYRGKAVMPDFKGRDRGWNTYRTRIRKGIEGGVNFAGKLAIIEIGCGTGCLFVPIADVSTGQVHTFPMGGEEYNSLLLKYRADSSLIQAQWLEGERCIQDFVVWTGAKFGRLGQRDIGPAEACFEY